MPVDSIFDAPVEPVAVGRSRAGAEEATKSLQKLWLTGRQISTLSPQFVPTDLDYELFQIDSSQPFGANEVSLPTPKSNSRNVSPISIAQSPIDGPVWVATGTTGCVKGAMSTQPQYIKMEGSETFQEMWVLELDRATSKYLPPYAGSV